MKNNNYIYYGLFLDENTKNEIKDYIRHIDGYNQLLENGKREYIDHCTLLFHTQEDKFPQVKKELVELESRGFDRYSAMIMKVTHIGYLENKVMAIRVNLFDCPCANEFPHITLCTFGDGKPVDSNKITEWKELETSFHIYGSLNKIVP